MEVRVAHADIVGAAADLVLVAVVMGVDVVAAAESADMGLLVLAQPAFFKACSLEDDKPDSICK